MPQYKLGADIGLELFTDIEFLMAALVFVCILSYRVRYMVYGIPYSRSKHAARYQTNA